jgi:adenosylmethionine-8-amino-7-oxononanoate aminotransferase
MKLKGLIPDSQQYVNQAQPYWKFGLYQDGKPVVDRLLHHACFNLGYIDEYGIVDFVSDVVKSNKPEIAESYTPNAPLYLNDISFKFSQKLYDITNGYKSFYALSGSDANEGAVKLASAYHNVIGDTRKNVVSLIRSYHGSTMMTSSLGSDSLMANPFYTMDPHPDVIRVDVDFDIDSINWSEVSCFVVETCSYGRGLHPFSKEFWQKLKYIRAAYDVLIVIDDIFMGGGKGHSYVGWHDLPIKPDIATMGKAITGGFFPLSMVLYNERVDKRLGDKFIWEHGFTYNFSLPGIASAYKYIQILEEQNLLNGADDLIERATDLFNRNGKMLENHGTIFRSETIHGTHMYMIPLNADDEYFEVLESNLKDKTIII